MFHAEFNAFECDSCAALTTVTPRQSVRATWFALWATGWRAYRGIGQAPGQYACPACEDTDEKRGPGVKHPPPG